MEIYGLMAPETMAIYIGAKQVIHKFVNGESNILSNRAQTLMAKIFGSHL